MCGTLRNQRIALLTAVIGMISWPQIIFVITVRPSFGFQFTEGLSPGFRAFRLACRICHTRTTVVY